MATVTITINTDNDAFEDGAGGAYEVARILHNAASEMEKTESITAHSVRDSSGNTVGAIAVEAVPRDVYFSRVPQGYCFFYKGHQWMKISADTAETISTIRVFRAKDIVNMQ